MFGLNNFVYENSMAGESSPVRSTAKNITMGRYLSKTAVATLALGPRCFFRIITTIVGAEEVSRHTNAVCHLNESFVSLLDWKRCCNCAVSKRTNQNGINPILVMDNGGRYAPTGILL